MKLLINYLIGEKTEMIKLTFKIFPQESLNYSNVKINLFY